MQLKSLRLKNIKSHKDTTVNFQPGINAIIGDNGSGKSTLLEAIGDVLFQSLDYKSKQFIRFGEKKGRIELTVEINDESFEIVKTFGSNSEYYIKESTAFGNRIDLKGEIVPALHQIFGIEQSVDLTRLFQDVIGVPQGMQTSHFLLPTASRKKIFDPILNIESYPDAWSNLLHIVKFSDVKIQNCNLNIERMSVRASDIDELIAERNALTKQITSLKDSVDDQSIVAERLSLEKKSLEVLEKLKSTRDQLVFNLKNNESEMLNTTKALREIEIAKKDLKALEPKLRHMKAVGDELANISGKFARWAINRHNREKKKLEITMIEDGNTAIKSQLEDYDKVTRLASTLTAVEQELQDFESSLMHDNHIVEHLEGFKHFVDDGLCPILETKCSAENLEKRFNTMLESAKDTEKTEAMIAKIKPKFNEAKRAMDERRNLDSLTEKLRENLEELKELEEITEAYDEQHKDIETITPRKVELEKEQKNHVELEAKKLTFEKTISDQERQEKNVEKFTPIIVEQTKELTGIDERLKDFDSDALEYIRTKHQEAVVELTTLTETLRNADITLSAVTSKVDARKNALQEKVAEERRLERLTLIHNKIVEVRELMKTIPEHLVERYLTHINYDANAIFSDITNRESTIDWTSNYEVIVDNKTFAQLSGGEQMIVALSIRLALLKNLTKIDVAIFDEPTVNLDEEHRTGLAEMIRDIKGLQILVVSHDDTFSSVIENVIQIKKEDGTSQVI